MLLDELESVPGLNAELCNERLVTAFETPSRYSRDLPCAREISTNGMKPSRTRLMPDRQDLAPLGESIIRRFRQMRPSHLVADSLQASLFVVDRVEPADHFRTADAGLDLTRQLCRKTSRRSPVAVRIPVLPVPTHGPTVEHTCD